MNTPEKHRDNQNRWILGETLPGVTFSMNQNVRIASGPNTGTVGQVISIRSLEPEPVFLLETSDWSDVEAAQSDLVGISDAESEQASNAAAASARRKLAEAARDMLAGKLSFIEGARELNALRVRAQLPEFDPDIIVFVEIDSETVALPFGDVRKHWSAEALSKIALDIERLEQWAERRGRPACDRLVERFGPGGNEQSRHG